MIVYHFEVVFWSKRLSGLIKVEASLVIPTLILTVISGMPYLPGEMTQKMCSLNVQLSLCFSGMQTIMNLLLVRFETVTS